MKKAPFLFLCLCPYGYIAVMGLLFLLSRSVLALDNDALVFTAVGVFLLLPGIFSIWYLLVSCPPEVSALRNLHLKLLNLPAIALAIGILTYSVISTSKAAAQGAQEGGLAVFLWIVLLLPVFVHSLCLLWATAITAIRISKYTEPQPNPMLLLLHWIPVADLAASFFLSRETNR